VLTKRIIPCLDVANGDVVKGVEFRNHLKVGSIIELSERYNSEGADELVFYDIKASTTNSLVSKKWIKEVAKNISHLEYSKSYRQESIKAVRYISFSLFLILLLMSPFI